MQCIGLAAYLDNRLLLLLMRNKTKIINAIEYENSKIRNFAVMATTKHFKNIKGYSDYRTVIQCFAVFKEINSRWNYVSDPKAHDYIATATESLLYFSGDCDDHSILMAASIRAIGGTPRLIHTKGHIYPEILIGSQADLEKVNFLISNPPYVRHQCMEREQKERLYNRTKSETGYQL